MWFIAWIISEWYHFKRSRHADTFWFGLFAADWRWRDIEYPDLRSRMSFHVDRGRVVIEYAPLAA